MIILIRNIDRSISEEEVRKLLEAHGKVRTFDLVIDKETGKSKGFGFADMADLDQAAKAIKALDGLPLGTLKLRVKRAAASSLLKPDQPRPKAQAKKEFFARKNKGGPGGSGKRPSGPPAKKRGPRPER